MFYRRLGRLNWEISEIGYGMWGLSAGEGGWVGSDDAAASNCLNLAVDFGCNFFDTAWIYGRGNGEKLLGRLLKERKDEKLYAATKIPPENRCWPSKRGDRFDRIFPIDHCRNYIEKSLKNLNVDTIDLLQFHVWEDAWHEEDSWKSLVEELKSQKIINGIGLSINRWEPWNCLNTLKTNLIDTVQVIYNIFDQSPVDELFPLCNSLDIGIIARVPFDEGALTGTLTKNSTWPSGDWRSTYFVPENLIPSVEHSEEIKKILPEGMTLAEAALGFILAHPFIATTIPGMRSKKHVEANLTLKDRLKFSGELITALSKHRWDREPTLWSQ